MLFIGISLPRVLSQGDKGDGGVNGIDGTAGLKGVKVIKHLHLFTRIALGSWGLYQGLY